MYGSIKTPRISIDTETGKPCGLFDLDEAQRRFLQMVVLPENLYRIAHFIIYNDYKRLGEIIVEGTYKNTDLELLNKIRQDYIKYKWQWR